MKRVSVVVIIFVILAFAISIATPVVAHGRRKAPVFTTLHSFQGADGCEPEACLAQGRDGALYGSTEWGGAKGHGSIFKITTAGMLTTLYSFSTTDTVYTAYPGTLALGDDAGNDVFYGTTMFGAAAPGPSDVFKITPSGILTTVHKLSANGDGYGPQSGVIKGLDGDCYGTTTESLGPDGGGTVFRVTPNGVFSTLATFPGYRGWSGDINVMQASDGNLYVTTLGVTASDEGAIYKVTQSGVKTLLHSFTGLEGSHPKSSLVEGKDSRLYGTTSSGGPVITHNIGSKDAKNIVSISGFGTAFAITPEGKFTTLYTFGRYPGGSRPLAGLTLGPDGNFYGTTADGGEIVNDKVAGGTIFEITPQGKLTTLHSFTPDEGRAPDHALIIGADGCLYGTTPFGGAHDKGSVFKLAL